jgi:hypothetical protein
LDEVRRLERRLKGLGAGPALSMCAAMIGRMYCRWLWQLWKHLCTRTIEGFWMTPRPAVFRPLRSSEAGGRAAKMVVAGARYPLTKPVVIAVELQAATVPHCSRGVQPGGIYVYVAQREPTPGGPGLGLRPGRKRFLKGKAAPGLKHMHTACASHMRPPRAARTPHAPTVGASRPQVFPLGVC